jgi:formylglycine-generating enzyme required for sulfatase activity
MVWVPGGEFAMGSEQFYPEERPVRRVAVDGFWMDEHAVTNEEFARFVDVARYVTVAERPLDAADYPGADPDLLAPGSAVFRRTTGPVDLSDNGMWWEYVVGASWRRPEGADSDLEGRGRHPVVHVAWEDVHAFAQWSGKQLPTEAEWEFAARGGLEGATFAWGNDHFPGGQAMANTWQGEFPWQNLLIDGYEGTSPVGSFPPNGYGLLDITGNVWEWTSDYYTTFSPAQHSCCVPNNPRVAAPADSFGSAGEPGATFPRMVIKGGSHLCAPNYCLRYRPAARQPQMVDTGTAHVGFRCIVRPAVT